MACGVDLWEVDRYVSAGAVVLCEPCVDMLKRAVENAQGTGEIEIDVPPRAPRIHGAAPDEEAAPAITRAFGQTFDSDVDQLDDYLEDAVELEGLLAQARLRAGPGSRFGACVEGIRFRDSDFAEVRFQILMNGHPMGAFQGSAARHDDRRWRVTRQTVARVLGNYGVEMPPRRP